MPKEEIPRCWILVESGDPATSVLDAVLLARPLVVGLVTLAKGTHVHHEDVDLRFGVVLACHDRLFGGVHAADGRAVVMRRIARADALQEGEARGGASRRRGGGRPR